MDSEGTDPIDPRAWAAVTAAIDAGVNNSPRAFHYLLRPLFAPPINFYVAYKYAAFLTRLLTGECCDFYVEESRIRELAGELEGAWVALTGWPPERFLHAMLVSTGMRESGDDRPRLEHLLAASVLLTRRCRVEACVYREDLAKALRKHPLNATVHAEFEWIDGHRAHEE